MNRIAIYPGTFDPVTNGHLDIMRRSVKLFGKLIVAVSLNPTKTPVFSQEKRVNFISEAIQDLENIEIVPFDDGVGDPEQSKEIKYHTRPKSE